MLQFVLEFLQAILGKHQKQFYTFVDRLRIANFVRFERREIVLLLRCFGANKRGRDPQAENQEEKKRPFEVHGCFSAGGAAPCCSTGRWGKSSFRSSSSALIRSRRTIWSGGLYPSGDTSSVSSTSRMPFRTCISS